MTLMWSTYENQNEDQKIIAELIIDWKFELDLIRNRSTADMINISNVFRSRNSSSYSWWRQTIRSPILMQIWIKEKKLDKLSGGKKYLMFFTSKYSHGFCKWNSFYWWEKKQTRWWHGIRSGRLGIRRYLKNLDRKTKRFGKTRMKISRRSWCLCFEYFHKIENLTHNVIDLQTSPEKKRVWLCP